MLVRALGSSISPTSVYHGAILVFPGSTVSILMDRWSIVYPGVAYREVASTKSSESPSTYRGITGEVSSEVEPQHNSIIF